MKNFTVYNPRIVLEDTLKNGGGTFTLEGNGVSFDSGYMVSLWGYEHQVNIRDNDLLELGWYRKHAALLTIVGQYMQYVNHIFHMEDDEIPELRAYIGTWINDGVIYLDVSRNIQERDEAIEVARYHKQRAIWDCANNAEIEV